MNIRIVCLCAFRIFVAVIIEASFFTSLSAAQTATENAQIEVSDIYTRFEQWKADILTSDTPVEPQNLEFLRRKRQRAETITDSTIQELMMRSINDQFLRNNIPMGKERTEALLSRLYINIGADEQKDFADYYIAKLKKLDADNTAWVKKQLSDRNQWFRISEVGPEAATDWWLLVQHGDPQLQELALHLMTPLLEQGELDESNYALLWDRVAIYKGKQQLYGSQMHCVDGKFEPFPIKDVENLDSRRAEFDMEPFSKYRSRFDPSMCKK